MVATPHHSSDSSPIFIIKNITMEYTQEQKDEIMERVKIALDKLKELQLTPAAQVYKVNIGNDTFADKFIPYLQDTRYSEKELTKEDKEALNIK